MESCLPERPGKDQAQWGCRYYTENRGFREARRQWMHRLQPSICPIWLSDHWQSDLHFPGRRMEHYSLRNLIKLIGKIHKIWHWRLSLQMVQQGHLSVKLKINKNIFCVLLWILSVSPLTLPAATVTCLSSSIQVWKGKASPQSWIFLTLPKLLWHLCRCGEPLRINI